MPRLFSLIVFLFFGSVPGLTVVDSLLEEAAFLYQIKGQPKKAASIYRKILKKYPEIPHAVGMAQKGIEFCEAVSSQKRVHHRQAGDGSKEKENNQGEKPRHVG